MTKCNWLFFCWLVVEELRCTRSNADVCGFVAECVITLLLTASLLSLVGRDVVVTGVPVDCTGWTRSDRLLPGWVDSLANSSCYVTQHATGSCWFSIRKMSKLFDAHCCHTGTAIKHHVPDRVKTGWASECPDVKHYKWRLNLVRHRMLYSCTHMATVGVKGLS